MEYKNIFDFIIVFKKFKINIVNVVWILVEIEKFVCFFKLVCFWVLLVKFVIFIEFSRKLIYIEYVRSGKDFC